MNRLRIMSNAFVIWKKLHQVLTVFKQASPFKLVVKLYYGSSNKISDDEVTILSHKVREQIGEEFGLPRKY